MGVPYKIFRAYLVDESGKSYYVDQNGNVQKQTLPIEIPHLPKNWEDQSIEYARNMRYFGIDRTYTPAYTFVKQAATIIRHLFYTQRGIEAQLYYNVVKWNPNNGVYEVYFSGEVDLSTADDDPLTGITVNIIQGGPAKYIKAYENTTYSFACNQSTPEAIRVLFDGINQQTIYRFQIGQVQHQHNVWAIPLTLIGTEGSSLNFDGRPQALEDITNLLQYVQTSQNSCGHAYHQFASVPFEGSFVFTNLGSATTVRISFYNSDDVRVDLYDGPMAAGETRKVIFSDDIAMLKERNLFLIFEQADNSNFEFGESDIQITVVSRVDATTAFALKPFDLFTKLIEKITNGQYRSEGSLLQDNANFVVLGGDQLRGLESGVIKTSLVDFYTSYGNILNGAIGIRLSDQTILFERKEYFFDNTIQIIDLGEVSNLKIDVAKDWLCSSIQVGYPDQSNNQANDKLEYNSEQIYNTPVTRVNKQLNLLSKYRADAFGIEAFRADLGNNTISDNKNSNEVFIVDVANVNTSVPPNNIVVSATFAYTSTGEVNLFGQAAQLRQYFAVGTVFQVSATTSNNRAFTVNAVAVIGDDLFLQVDQYASDEVAPTAIFDFSFYRLNRPAYVPLDGVYDNTVYNVELSPKRNLLRNGSYISGGMKQLPNELVAFASAKKSKDLIAGTVSEAGSVRVSQLDASFMNGYKFSFDTRVDQGVIGLLQSAGRGYINGTYNGVPFYGFVEKVTVKPSFQDAQTWELLCSSRTDISRFVDINEQPLQISGMGIISHKNSMRFVPLNRTYPAQYHFKQMDTDWWKNRTDQYIFSRNYFQKRQTNDNETIQFITRGASVACKLINCAGEEIADITFTQVTHPSVINPNILWQATIDWSIYPAGTYYLLPSFGIGAGKQDFISEPIATQADWPRTLLFEYTNSQNTPDMIFQPSVFTGKLRVEGTIIQFKPGMKRTDYEDQPLDVVTLYGLGYRGYHLFIGGEYGVPDYIYDKLNRILLLDTITIDGFPFVLDRDAKWEDIEIQGSPFVYTSIAIREAVNNPGITLSGDGSDPGDLSMTYNLNTKGITNISSPNANQQDNIIQVPELP